MDDPGDLAGSAVRAALEHQAAEGGLICDDVQAVFAKLHEFKTAIVTESDAGAHQDG